LQFRKLIPGFPSRTIHDSGAEFGVFFNQKLFAPRPKSVLSDDEGRLGGAISEPCCTENPEDPYQNKLATPGYAPKPNNKAI